MRSWHDDSGYVNHHRTTAMRKTTTPPTIGLSLRVPIATRDALEELARQRRMATGANCTTADLCREALDAFLIAHGMPAETEPAGDPE